MFNAREVFQGQQKGSEPEFCKPTAQQGQLHPGSSEMAQMSFKIRAEGVVY